MTHHLREAAQQALEALEQSRVFVTTREKIKHTEGTEWYDERITALRAALEEPVQEQPVCDECGKSKRDGWALYCVDCLEPMFAQRKPLTEEGIYSLFRTSGSPTAFARAIERAHGIGGNDE